MTVTWLTESSPVVYVPTYKLCMARKALSREEWVFLSLYSSDIVPLLNVPRFVPLGSCFESCFSMPSTCAHFIWVHAMFLWKQKPVPKQPFRMLVYSVMALPSYLMDAYWSCVCARSCVRVWRNEGTCMVFIPDKDLSGISIHVLSYLFFFLVSSQCRPLVSLGFPTYAIHLGSLFFLLLLWNIQPVIQTWT